MRREIYNKNMCKWEMRKRALVFKILKGTLS